MLYKLKIASGGLLGIAIPKKSCFHSDMQLKIKKISLSLMLCVTVFSASVYSQTVKKSQGLSLEDELNLEPETKNNPEPSGLEKQVVSNTSSQGKDANHAFKGMAFGALAFNQSYTATLALNLDGSNRKVSGKASDVQFVGGVIRYTVFPYNKIGTDLAISGATSVNHATIGYEPMTVLKTEVNFGYSWYTLARTSVYLMGGLGYEYIRGRTIENFLAPGGGLAQFGAGINYSQTLSMEGFVGISRHGVARNYSANAVTTAQNQGFTSVTFDDSKSFITAIAITGRLIFHF